MTLQDDQTAAKVLITMVATLQCALRNAAVVSGLAALIWPL